MSNRKLFLGTTLIGGAVVCGFILVGLGVFWYYTPHPNSATTETLYTNESRQFSFSSPKGYVVHETDTVVTVENASGDGIQILITPVDEDIPIMTAERIRADIPDLVITNAEEVAIGDNRMGLAFKSDNLEFDGASREVWFVYPECSRGVCDPFLYQISTYDRLDPVLKALFATWTFL